MTASRQVASTQDGLTLTAYGGDGAVLLGFDLAPERTPHLAGFALRYTPPGGQPTYIANRLNFATPVTAATPPGEPPWTPSDQAPLQKFRWTHFPPQLAPGAYTYELTAIYFAGGGLQPGPTTSVAIELAPPAAGDAPFEVGFTTGDLASQAYADRFHNAPIVPTPKTLDYATAPYEAQYAWLGGHARRLVFDFLHACLADPDSTVDLFAYDLDEPDVVRLLQQLGPRLRAVLDDAPLHTKPGALEIEAKARLIASAGADHVKAGHFHRFAHSKVLIRRQRGTPTQVLTGSANFSVRGLYVQANNVLVFRDARTAGLYAQAFEQAFTAMAGFARAPIAGSWFDLTGPGLPTAAVCFSPHPSAKVSLDRVSAAIKGAKSSVMFAVMELEGGGDVLADLQALGTRADVFSFGVTQAESGLKVYPPGTTDGVFAAFGYLKDHVPAPFQAEWGGGVGQVIHHKFVVVDFNDASPQVFTGSSNLAEGGEEQNGDNLLAIADPGVAARYAVEAVRLVDHYHFRAAKQAATEAAPLVLQPDAARWWAPYYDPTRVEYRERALFNRAAHGG